MKIFSFKSNNGIINIIVIPIHVFDSMVDIHVKKEFISVDKKTIIVKADKSLVGVREPTKRRVLLLLKDFLKHYAVRGWLNVRKQQYPLSEDFLSLRSPHLSFVKVKVLKHRGKFTFNIVSKQKVKDCGFAFDFVPLNNVSTVKGLRKAFISSFHGNYHHEANGTNWKKVERFIDLKKKRNSDVRLWLVKHINPTLRV